VGDVRSCGARHVASGGEIGETPVLDGMKVESANESPHVNGTSMTLPLVLPLRSCSKVLRRRPQIRTYSIGRCQGVQVS
jgi:hypothetical protein